MAAPEDLSRDELTARVRWQDEQIATLAAQVADLEETNDRLAETNERLGERLARLEHALSRNSANSSARPSRDDEPGETPPGRKGRGDRSGGKRKRGKQLGAPGSHLVWTDDPNDRHDRYPEGRCDCGHALAAARDRGIVDRDQAHEIPQVSVQVVQYDQHQVQCRCGVLRPASRPDGARSGPVGYGPSLQAFAVYLMVVHFVPVGRCAAILESLTGAAPSEGFVHGLVTRAAGAGDEVDKRIRALITLARVVCADETPLRVGSATPAAGKKKAQRYLHVACTELYTHYLLGDRSMGTFTASVLAELAEAGAVVVHDRYQNDDSAQLAGLVHQLCCAHLLRDVDDAGQVFQTEQCPVQIADALRGLIDLANQARAASLDEVDPERREQLLTRLRHGIAVGLSETTTTGNQPGQRKARLLLETLRDRWDDVLRFVSDLRIPPTSNQAERDLRPAKIQQNISGRLTSEARTHERYTIRGYVSTAAKHGQNQLIALRDALTGKPWMPDLAPT